MDLENFPTREMAKDMMDMISPIYDESYVGKWIFEVMSVPLALARQTVDDLMSEAFTETTTWAISMWEQEFGIESNESLSIEERRKALTLKRNYRRPMNPWRIEQLVGEISGRKATVIENVEPHTYEICIGDGDNDVDINAVYNAVYKVKQSQKHVRIVYESVVGVRIRAEPKGIVFPYPMAGTEPYPYNVGSADTLKVIADTEDTGMVYPITAAGRVKAGALPDRNYVGTADVVPVALTMAEAEGVFLYTAAGRTVAGTAPDRNNIASLDSILVVPGIGETESVFAYAPAGTTTAGTKPDITIVASAETPGISANISDESVGIVYKICGAKRLR